MDKYKQRILYRYDPPVVLISLTWQETRAKFSPHLRQKLGFSYFNNDEDVSASSLQNHQSKGTKHPLQLIHLNIVLDGTTTGNVVTSIKAGMVDPSTVVQFLTRHKTAKIVVIVDTHCLAEDGRFIWRRNKDESFEACTMKEVSRVLL